MRIVPGSYCSTCIRTSRVHLSRNVQIQGHVDDAAQNIAYLHDEVVQKNEYPLKYYKTAGKTPGLTSLGVEYVLIRICGYLW